MDRKYKQWAAIGLISAIIIGAALFYPVSQARLISAGVDTYSAHRPLFGNHTLSQTISSRYPLTGLGFILVDLRRAKKLSDVSITISSLPDHSVVLQKNIPASSIKDDTFARVEFAPVTVADEFEVSLGAPAATKESPIGVRTDPGSGSLALEILEKVPAWRALVNAAGRYRDSWTTIAIAVAITALAAALAFVQRKTYQIIILAGLAIAAFVSRIPVITSFGGVSGGDPYNYLLMARSLAHLESPFNEGEKRLPGYPVLLIPTVLSPTINDHLYMRTTSALAAAGSLIMLAVLARTLGLPWPVQLFAPLLIAWQKDFFATSTRPEPYTLYTFLLLTALVLFFSRRRQWQEILFGVLLGWAALTRQEGFVLAALLGMAWFFLPHPRFVSPDKGGKGGLKKTFSFLRLFLPALLIVSPFFIHNARLYGNPFTTPYFEGDRLQIVDSWEAFKDNLGATWGVIGSLWRPSWDQLERYALPGLPIILGAGVTLVWWKSKFQQSNIVIAVCVAVGFILLTLTAKHSVIAFTPPFLAGIALVSPFIFIVQAAGPPKPWHRRGIIVLLVGLSQLLIATWFHPFAKHYQQILPPLALMMTYAWLSPVANNRGELARIVAASTVLLLPAAWLTLLTYDSITIMIDKQNANAALDSVTYRAVKFALTQRGPYGADQGYLPARLYFGHDGRYFYDDQSTPAQETRWLTDNGVRTFVTTNDGQTFPTPHPHWQELKRFRAEGKDEHIFESIVYRIPTP